jgi:hypothetical protein
MNWLQKELQTRKSESNFEQKMVAQCMAVTDGEKQGFEI